MRAVCERGGKERLGGERADEGQSWERARDLHHHRRQGKKSWNTKELCICCPRPCGRLALKLLRGKDHCEGPANQRIRETSESVNPRDHSEPANLRNQRICTNGSPLLAGRRLCEWRMESVNKWNSRSGQRIAVLGFVGLGVVGAGCCGVVGAGCCGVVGAGCCGVVGAGCWEAGLAGCRVRGEAVVV
jgi:hypothetical protein